MCEQPAKPAKKPTRRKRRGAKKKPTTPVARLDIAVNLNVENPITDG